MLPGHGGRAVRSWPYGQEQTKVLDASYGFAGSDDAMLVGIYGDSDGLGRRAPTCERDWWS